MSIQINIAAAKAKLSELVARAEAGEEVVIARDGKPVVALAPIQAVMPSRRRLGLWDDAGVAIPEDIFLGPDSEIQQGIEPWEMAPIYPAR